MLFVAPMKRGIAGGALLTTLLLSALVLTRGGFAADEKELYVSTIKAPVHASPDGYSDVLGTLEYGAKVQVTERVKTREGAGQRPGWVKIKADNLVGYLPAACLVTKRLLARQSNISEEDVAKANRKFSEAEKGDLTVMKGMGGAASGGNANFPAVDKILAEQGHATERKQENDGFRKAGKLGEYKEK